MTENKTKEPTVFKPHFCGGIFFAILLESKTNKNDTQVFDGLVHLFKGSSNTEPKADGRSIDKSVSNYKKCLESSKTYIPFINGIYQNAFLDKYNEKRQELYNALFKFCEEYLDGVEASKTALIKRLIGIMQLEELNTNILIDYENEKPVSEIKTNDTVQFYPVLLSIMHYAFTQVPDVDEHHKDSTFKHLFTQKNKNSKWELSKEQDKQLIGKLTNLTVMFDRKTVTSNEESNPFPPKNTDNLNSKEYDFELSLIDKYHQNAVKKFNTYLDKAFKRYSREKTLLDPNSYSNITDFYVSNNIEIKSTIIENPTVTKLTKISKHLIIQGTAGLGKTTLIKYLFINASKSVSNSGIIPILVDRLNRYSGESILDYVSKNVQEFDSNVSLADIENAFNNSSLLLLIDGIDEIKHKYTTEFILQLESFLNMYFNTHIIITSRPVDDFMQFSSFIVGKICPFSVEQSIMFVEKQNLETIKKKHFIEDIYHYTDKSDHFNCIDIPEFVNLPDKYQTFISNPLLLMILLITYTPGDLFIINTTTIYQKIYEILAKRHDSTKGIIKEYRTQLSFDDFYDYFAEFCALTYEDQVGEFSYLQLKSYTKRIKFKGKNISTEDFVSDLKNNVSLLKEEGDRYYFIHRSFQEYFAAVHYSSLPDKDFTKLISVFNRRLSNDETLSMLIEIAPKKVKRLIFIPFLDQVMSKETTCESFKEYIRLSSNYIKFDEFNLFTILGSDLTNKLERVMLKEFDGDDLPSLFPPVSDDIYNTKYDSLYAKAAAYIAASRDPISESELDLIERELYSGKYQELEFKGVPKDILPSPLVIPTDYIFEHLNQYTNTFKYLCTPSKSLSMRIFIYLERYYGRLKKEFLF